MSIALTQLTSEDKKSNLSMRHTKIGTDGSQRELSSSNVTPRLGASACVLEQLPSQQRMLCRPAQKTKTGSSRTPMEEPWKLTNKIISATKAGGEEDAESVEGEETGVRGRLAEPQHVGIAALHPEAPHPLKRKHGVLEEGVQNRQFDYSRYIC
ncbi:hypothetical protein OPV22_014721 [Ensete ventricosum]|uniref:Uncharacterized protein n=1 Tax=Ensete ventricosum TaxID=4639 RepID=A0AAV8RBA7_ENSVE|nr:hypothetical protein OPV22_014721 [Ensete ventricosum]